MKTKCRFCDLKDTEREQMEVEVYQTASGNVQRKYFHKDCYPKYLKDKEFKKHEQDEMDKLIETIMQIHQISNMPHQFYPFIQDLRNGTVLFGKKKKKYKEGYPFSLIEKTYQSCRESIEYWKKNKQFESTMSELKYGWAIINDKINVVKKKEEKKEFAKRKDKLIENEYKNKGEEKNDSIKPIHKKKDELDISDFL